MLKRRSVNSLIGLTIELVLSLTYWSASTASLASTDWQFVAKVAPPELKQQLNRDYQADLKAGGYNRDFIDVRRMRMLTIREGTAMPLYLINTRLRSSSDSQQSPTCGIAGCLFYGYVTQGTRFQRVLHTYISDLQLGPTTALVQSAHRISENIPCIQINAYSQVSHRAENYTLCSKNGNF